MQKTRLSKFIITAGALILPTSSQSAGYLIQETSTLYAQAYAGRAAIADACAMFVNPAVMGFLNKHAIVVHGSYIHPSTKFSKGSGTTVTTGSNGGNGGRQAGVPSVYFVYNAAPRLKFGLAVTSPFGLSTKYQGTWVGRYTAVKSELHTLNINPNIAYRGECFSIGFGLSIQRAEAFLSKKVDVDARALGGTQQDALVKVRGHNTALGLNVGFMYEPCPSTRIGISYRSRISHNVRGNVTFLNLPNFGAVPIISAAARSAFVDGRIIANLKTPDIVNLSATYDINKQWTVLGDIMFTRWTVLRQIEVKRLNNNQSLPPEVQGWRNTWMPSVGLNYKPNNCWTFRTGTAYDQTPTRNKHRNARLPDQSRIWASAGVDYNMNECTSFRLAYAHLFTRKAKINNTIKPLPLLPGSTLKGKFKNRIDIVGLQVNIQY